MEILRVESPCPTSYPHSFARDHRETYLVPPYSTCYGFSLSLVGETNVLRHLGVKIGMAVIGDLGQTSWLLRKTTNIGLSKGGKFANKPKMYEVVPNRTYLICIDSSNEVADLTLESRIAIALDNPSQINRFGSLCLGESHCLVNVRRFRAQDTKQSKVNWLIQDMDGEVGLPIWINHFTTANGIFRRFNLMETIGMCPKDVLASLQDKIMIEIEGK